MAGWQETYSVFLYSPFQFSLNCKLLNKLSITETKGTIQSVWSDLMTLVFPDWLTPPLLFFLYIFAIPPTGSRGDVFVVRTSEPVENLWKNGLFWSRYDFVTHSIDRKPRDWGLARSACTSCLGRPPGDGLRSTFGRRAVRKRGYGLRLLIFKSRSGSDKKRRNRLQ